MPPFRNSDTGASISPSDRQGHPDRRIVGPYDGGEGHRPFTAVPAIRFLGGPADDCSFDFDTMGRTEQRVTPASGRCVA